MAKQASDKAVDARFAILEASAKRANNISSALRNMIMAVGSAAGSAFMNRLFKGSKKQGASSKSNKKKMQMGEAAKGLAKSVMNLAIVAGITGAAAESIREDKNQREAENKEGKTDMSKSVGDAASSDKGQQLSGLENRALNAQMNAGATQEMESLDRLLKEMEDKLGNALAAAAKAAMSAMKAAVDATAKAAKPKGSDSVADVDADFQKELQDAGVDEEKIKAAKANRNERMKGIIDNLKGDKHQLATMGKFGGDIYARIRGKKPKGKAEDKVTAKTDAQLNKEFDDLTNEMMEFAEKDGESSDNLKGKSYNELERQASNPNASPELRKAARGAMVDKAVPAIGFIKKSYGQITGVNLQSAFAVLKVILGAIALAPNVLALPMIQNALKNTPGGQTDTERAESIKGAAVAMAFANERGSGQKDKGLDLPPAGEAAKKRRALMASNPGVVQDMLARQSGRETLSVKSYKIAPGTAGKALQQMMSSKDPSMGALAATVVANSPGSIKANMENAMEAFKGDDKALLNFMDKVSSNGPGGAKVARQMLDSVGGKDDAMAKRMQKMLATPESAKRISAIRAKGLDNDSRVGHKLMNSSNGMVKQLRQLKNQIKEGKGSTSKTERGAGKESDVAASMIQLFAEGDSETEGMTLDALNSTEKGAITDVLKGLMSGSKVKVGNGLAIMLIWFVRS